MSADAQETPQAAAGNDIAGPEPTTDRQEAATAAAAAPTQAEPESAAEATEEVPETTRPKPTLCGICEKVEAKYKCPRCALP